MIEVKGDIWDFHNKGYWIVVPTNGFIKNNGECVMGRGIALQAKVQFPDLPFDIGKLIRRYGNVVFALREYRLLIFPVKHNWYEKADLSLIEKSSKELETIFHYNLSGIPTPIYIPRVGCGNGRLDWKYVKPILNKYLNENFVVVNNIINGGN